MTVASSLAASPSIASLDPVVAAWLGNPVIPTDIAPPPARHHERLKSLQQDHASSTPDGDSLLHDMGGEQARVHALLQRLDAGIDAATFGAAWEEAGADDPARVLAFAAFLAQAMNVPAAGETPSISRLEEVAATASGNARFIRLASHSGSELEAIATGDRAMRRALGEHDRWALVGDSELSRRSDPGGRYDRFDPDTGEALLSDAWIGDRARHAAWVQAAADGRPLQADGDGWRFIDRAIDAGASVEIAGSGSDVLHQVIFANDGGERIEGGATTDRIHGGAGEDMLRGRAGADLLQGADGDDVLYGGSGNDDVAGQRGDDELDGGVGNDRLDGGSGDDELVGNRGNDLLRGGSGIDTYHFESGDGVDTIEDDGGLLYFEGRLLSGTMRKDGDGWVSADSRYRMSLDGEIAQGGTLTIAANPGGDASDFDSVVIRHWKQGAFGIALGSDDADEAGVVASSASDAPVDSNASAAPADASADAIAASSAAYQPVGDGDTLYPPTLPDGSPVDWFGNEGSTGWPPPVPFHDTRMADVTLDSSAHEQVSPARTHLVDLDAVASAVATWAIPSPPDVGPTPTSDGSVPTLGDIANAIASEGGGDSDESAFVSLSFDPWSGVPEMRSLHTRSIHGPPEPMLRRSDS